MRVDQSTSNPVQSGEAKGTKHARKAQEAKGADKSGNAPEARGSSAAAANAEVSDRARTMASARAVANDAPDVREDKIAEIKARIAGGKYNIDSNAIADRMVDEHIRMSGIG